MSVATFLPAPARPPHDPNRLPLDRRVGWRIGFADKIEESPHNGALVLAPAPGSNRQLNEANGSFGGLTIPPNVAIANNGSVFLLDRESGALKRFDPCECHFDAVPCIGGVGSDPRQVSNPGGIGICGGNLFVADTGNRRLQVLSLHGFALRGLWVPPAPALEQPWQPVDVSFDHRGNVLVADPANGCVHVFNPGGVWLRCLEGVGAVNAIVTDCDDRVYVYVGPELAVRIFDLATEALLETESRVDKVASRFAPLPFPVTAEGYLQLGGLCWNKPTHSTLFDLNGEALIAVPEAGGKTFAGQGTYISMALDSRLYRCQWDRISLAGLVPDGTRVKVDTYTAETELSLAQIQNLNGDAWATTRTAFPGDMRSGWDCLVRSEGGRFLWLKLKLLGDGNTTPMVQRIVLDFPRISLRRYLPAVFGEEPVSADFSDRFLAVFDRGFRQIERNLDQSARFFDALSAPAGRGRKDFLGWLASWIGVVLDRQLPVARQRRILKAAGKLFPLRGTLCGLRQSLEVYLGLDLADCPRRRNCGPCTTREAPDWQPPQLILEHFKLRRWLFLGAGRLGDQAKLWGQKIVNRSQLSGPEGDGNARLGVTQLKTTQDPLRDPFHVYAHKFSVFVPGWFERSPQWRKGLEGLIQTEKPVHTAHQLIFVHPRFRIGVQSMIGFDAVIGCYPEGVIIDQSGLGKASILGSPYTRGPELRVGVDARIGTTTKLN